MGAWFRSNAVALAVVALAAPALLGVLLGLPLLENADSESPAVEVEAGEAVEVAGYTWEYLVSDEFTDAEGNDAIPSGLAVIGAIVEVLPVDPEEGIVTCEAHLVSTVEGDEREWRTVPNPADLGYAILDESEASCFLSWDPEEPDAEPEQLQLETVFLVPQGVYGSVALELVVNADEPVVLRFPMEG